MTCAPRQAPLPDSRTASGAATRSAGAAIPLAVVFAHADGFSWDEALLVMAPIAILAGVLLYANRKIQGAFGDPDPEDATEAEGFDDGDAPHP